MTKKILTVFLIFVFFSFVKTDVLAQWNFGGKIQLPNFQQNVQIPDLGQQAQNRINSGINTIENSVTDSINNAIQNQTKNVQQGLLDPVIRGANDVLKQAGLDGLQTKAQDFINNVTDVENLKKFIDGLGKNLTKEQKEDAVNQYINEQINKKTKDAGVEVTQLTYTKNALGQVATEGLLAGKNAKPTVGQIFSKVLPYIYIIAGLALLLFLIWGGIILMTAAGNPDKAKQGYGILSGALIGFLIIFISYFVVQLVQVMLGVKIL
jgi:hypothetical protein